MQTGFTVVVLLDGLGLDVSRLLQNVLWQYYPFWDVVLVEDNDSPRLGDLSNVLSSLPIPRERISYSRVEDENTVWNNHLRRKGIDLSRREYIVWIDSRCVLSPNYLIAHAENISLGSCLSIVGIDYWKGERYVGKMPDDDCKPDMLRKGQIDILNMAVPISAAREAKDVFSFPHNSYHDFCWNLYRLVRKSFPCRYSRQVVGARI